MDTVLNKPKIKRQKNSPGFVKRKVILSILWATFYRILPVLNLLFSVFSKKKGVKDLVFEE